MLNAFEHAITNPDTGAVSTYNCRPDNSITVTTTTTSGESIYSTYSDISQCDQSIHYGVNEVYSEWNMHACENDPHCGCVG